MVVGLRLFHQNPLTVPQVQGLATKILPLGTLNVQCSAKPAATQYNNNEKYSLRTCKNCKTQYDPALNHPRSCCYHTAHFGGETRRKFESVYSGGTMDSPDSGKVFQYWHCCGSEDPFDPGCTAAPHSSYDD